MNNYTPQDEFLARWLSGELSEEELADWKKHPEYQELSKILDASTSWEVPQNLTRAQAWQLFREKAGFTLEKAGPASIVPVRRLVFAGIAAVFALLMGLYFFLPEQLVIQKASFAQTTNFTLPDGSTVHLNAESEVSYYPEKWSQKREITLRGEAFFQVDHGNTFTVKTPRAEVSVLGTSFNVKDRNLQLEVQCYTGQVQVSVPEQQSKAVLRPNEGIRLNESGQINTFSFQEEASQPEWTQGRYSFRKAPLKIVVEELERQFDIEIVFDESETSAFTGTFYTGDLNEALQAVCTPLNLNYTTDENTSKIKLSRKSN